MKILSLRKDFLSSNICSHELLSREVSLNQMIYCDTADRGSFLAGFYLENGNSAEVTLNSGC